jgi:O-antigen ligase
MGIITVPAIVWAIVATHSRGGLLGLAAVHFAVFARKYRLNAFVLIPVCIVAAGLVMFTGAFFDRSTLGSSTGSALDDSSMDRLYFWQAALKMAISRPFTGVGLASFRSAVWFYTEHWRGYQDQVAHSTWMTVLGEIGFPGLAAFLAMIYYMFRTISRSYRLLVRANPPPIIRSSVIGLFGGLVGFCVSGTFLTQAYTWQIPILLAFTIAIGRYAASLPIDPDAVAKPDGSASPYSDGGSLATAASFRAAGEASGLEFT